jgi:uncharacterized protein (DUF1697 family)
MKTYIALLRGVNVSGQNKIPMAELRDLLSKSGFENVQTYIQSGNVVFQSKDGNSEVIENTIQLGIMAHFGFEVPVLVKTSNEIQTILNDCPLSEEKIENSYFTLLHSFPNKELVQAILKETYPNETFHIINDYVYFYSSEGYGKAKCNNNFFERKLKVSATTRNYKTMIKLLSLSAEN